MLPDIEEMSLKTGNFKKFTLFLRMLSSALSQSSETVFIDLLTFHDLEALKARKQAAATAGAGPHQNPHPLRQQPASTAQSAVAASQNKRYIILTYVSEFDKVHYPLPLKFETDPNPALLKATIARLRAEVDLMKSQGINAALGAAANQQQGGGNATAEKYKSEIYRLAEENHRLKSMMSARNNGSGGDGSAAADGSSSTSGAGSSLTPHEVDQLHLDLRSSAAQVTRLTAENADLFQKLSGLMQGLPLESLGLQLSLDNMSKQIANLGSELAAEQSAHLGSKRKYESEMEVMLRELEGRLEAERLLRKKCRELTQELEMSREELRILQLASRRAGVAAAAAAGGGLRSPAQRRPVSASSPSSGGRGSSMGRPLSRPNSRPSSAASSRSNSPAPSAFNRSGSAGGMSPAGSARGRGPVAQGGARSRSPSPALGGSGSRFDPSAYVKHKQEQLAKQQQRISAHNRDVRAGMSPQAAPAPPRARSPVVRNGGTRNLSETSPRPSRSASNASLSSTSPQALRHSYSQAGSSAAAARRSPAPSASSARAMPPRAPVTAGAPRPRPSSAAHARGEASPSSSTAARPRSSGGVRGSTATITDSDLDESTEYESQRASRSAAGAAAPSRRRDEFDDEDDRAEDHDRRSPRAAPSKKGGLSASDNIEERFSALQNFLKQQKAGAGEEHEHQR